MSCHFISQVAEERLSNIRTIRAFAAERKEELNYREKIQKVLQLAYKNAMASGIFYGFVSDIVTHRDICIFILHSRLGYQGILAFWLFSTMEAV